MTPGGRKYVNFWLIRTEAAPLHAAAPSRPDEPPQGSGTIPPQGRAQAGMDGRPEGDGVFKTAP